MTQHAVTTGQKRNAWTVLVTFPDDWPDEPTLAGSQVTFSYPSEDAALLARQGFRLRGATV
jgi:hypothetical protein